MNKKFKQGITLSLCLSGLSFCNTTYGASLNYNDGLSHSISGISTPETSLNISNGTEVILTSDSNLVTTSGTNDAAVIFLSGNSNHFATLPGTKTTINCSTTDTSITGGLRIVGNNNSIDINGDLDIRISRPTLVSSPQTTIAGILAWKTGNSTITLNGATNIEATTTNNAVGVQGIEFGEYGNDKFIINGPTTIKVEGKRYSIGISGLGPAGNNTQLIVNDKVNMDIKNDRGTNTFGYFLESGTASGAPWRLTNNSESNIKIVATGSGYAHSASGIGINPLGDSMDNAVFDIEEGAKVNIVIEGNAPKIRGIYVNQKNSVLNVNGEVNISVPEGYTAVYADNGGTVNWNSDMDLNAKNVLEAVQNGSKIIVNRNKNKTIKITGDVNSDQGGSLTLNLTNANSSFTGDKIGTSFASINLTSGATWTGKTTSSTTVEVKDNAVWKPTEDSIVDTLTLDKGHLDMHAAAGFKKVTAGALSGDKGVITLYTDLQASKDNYDVTMNSDKLIITGNSEGNHKIRIKDASLKNLLASEGYLLLVEDINSGAANFEGDSLATGGIFKYKPILTSINPGDNPDIPDGAKYTNAPTQNAKNWYLTGFEIDQTDPEPFQPSIKPNLASGAERYLNYWRELDNLQLRLGELRDTSNASGIWARIKAGKESINNIGLKNSRYQTYQLGFDHKYQDNAQGKRYIGFAFDHVKGTQEYSVSAIGESATTSFSIYDTWLGTKGHYLDLIAKIGRMGRSFDYTGEYPEHGDSHNWFYSLSGEYGRKFLNKNGFYVEPQTQLTLGRINSSDYTSDLNSQVHNDTVNSAVWRIGTTIGKHFGKEAPGKRSNVYGKFFWNKEFGGALGLDIKNGAESYNTTEYYGDTWWIVGIGANAEVNKKTNAYLDLEKTFGGNISTKWQVNAGMRLLF